MRWQQGREAIDGMITRREVERVKPNREQADLLLIDAHQHIDSAKSIMSEDSTGAYQLLYDAARKAFNAVLENQGLRVTSRGGHIATFEAVISQLDPPLGGTLRPFDRMRRRRNEAEYPSRDKPKLTTDEVNRDIVKTQKMVEAVSKVLDQMSPY